MTASPGGARSAPFNQPFGGYHMSSLGRQTRIEGFEKHL
jgi:hypothetical protein